MTLVLQMPQVYPTLPSLTLSSDDKRGTDLYMWGNPNRDFNQSSQNIFGNSGLFCDTASAPAVPFGRISHDTGQRDSEAKKPNFSMGIKRKSEPDIYEDYERPRKISPLWNTPKQRKDERKRILKISIQKLRAIEDPETFLRRSVLVHNTAKRMQKEIRDERMKKSLGVQYIYNERFLRPRMQLGFGILNNSYLPQPVFDDHLDCNDCDRLMDDSADNLLRSLKPSEPCCSETSVISPDVQSKRLITCGQQSNGSSLSRNSEQCKLCSSRPVCQKRESDNSLHSTLVTNTSQSDINSSTDNTKLITPTYRASTLNCDPLGSECLSSDCMCSECERYRFLAEKAITVEMDNVFNSLISIFADS